MKSYSIFNFELVNSKLLPHVEEEVMALWITRAGLGQPEAERRLRELVLLLRDETGKITGVSTATRTFAQQISNYVYLYRCFILPEFRAPGLDTQMIVRTKKFLESQESAADNPCVGIMVVIQNEIIQKHWRQAVWPGADMIYIGNTTQGQHIRIGYFKNARI